MADSKMGSYHLADNPSLYEVARSNNFEFVVTNLGDLLRAGANETDNNAYIKGSTAEDVIRLSVESSSVPTYKQAVLSLRRGNSVMKFAGLPDFDDGSLVVRDFIGADTKSALMAWQNLSYNVKTQKVGQMKNYKKDCYLMEYTPDMQLIRTWTLKGCWIAGLQMGEFNQESGDKRTITATIPYDYAIMSLPEEEE
jgi:hypothetical protein